MESWVQLAAYIRDHRLSRDEVKILLASKGMSEASAKVEASRFMRFQTSKEASDMLDRKLNNEVSDITIEQLRGLTGEKFQRDEIMLLKRHLRNNVRKAKRLKLSQKAIIELVEMYYREK